MVSSSRGSVPFRIVSNHLQDVLWSTVKRCRLHPILLQPEFDNDGPLGVDGGDAGVVVDHLQDEGWTEQYVDKLEAKLQQLKWESVILPTWTKLHIAASWTAVSAPDDRTARVYERLRSGKWGDTWETQRSTGITLRDLTEAVFRMKAIKDVCDVYHEQHHFMYAGVDPDDESRVLIRVRFELYEKDE